MIGRNFAYLKHKVTLKLNKAANLEESRFSSTPQLKRDKARDLTFSKKHG